jgi:hypothetical protein
VRHYLVAGMVRQKDGSERMETQAVRVSDRPGSASLADMGYDPADAVELARAPREHEKWTGRGLAVDETVKAERERAARLGGLTEEQLDAIAAAVAARLAAQEERTKA